MNVSEILACVSEEEPGTTLRRFSGNEALLVKFLKKFPDDLTFSELDRAVKAADYDSALTAAHTLKGLSGNLGFTKLFDRCERLVSYLRSGKREETAAMFNEIEDTYYTVLQALKQLD